MTHTLALAPAPQARVLSISPGVVDTDFVPGRTRKQIAKAGAATPPGKVTAPEDVAEAIIAAAVHLRHSTGTRIVVDAGRSHWAGPGRQSSPSP
jgi:3-oxoacyl-[acyl-carrier protein] reductase